MSNNADSDRPLRIGYISPDLRGHTIARLIEPILRSHNPDLFETYCYSSAIEPDETTFRLKRVSSHWRDIVRIDDESAGQMIRQDRIDILVDLTGHMAGNRLAVLARKPAPIQFQIGYSATTGMSAIDYRITDPFCDPETAEDNLHSERLIRLPDCAWCYHPDENGPAPSDPPCLRKGSVTFGCLNRAVKFSDPCIALWSQILDAVPRSVLAVLGGVAASLNLPLRERFARHGISHDRLLLIEGKPRSDYLQTYADIDIGLDPFPFNGDTTTCDALWMGVPVVTQAGTSFVARRGVSHLTNIGCQECIAENREEYVAIAARLARRPDLLREYRTSLRDKLLHSPLVDGKQYTRNLENAYRDAWIGWCTAHARRGM